jgi:cell division protease FtsH
VDAEVRALMDGAMAEAARALTTNRKVLDRLAEALLEKETLNETELAEIFKDVKRLPKRGDWVSGTWTTSTSKSPANRKTAAAKTKAASSRRAKPAT